MYLCHSVLLHACVLTAGDKESLVRDDTPTHGLVDSSHPGYHLTRHAQKLDAGPVHVA